MPRRSPNHRTIPISRFYQQRSVHRLRARTGTAPIEFLMFIPVIVAFMAVMIWMVRVQNRAIQVGIDAEVTAAEQAVILSQQPTLTASEQMGDLPAAKEFQQLVDAFAPSLSVTQGTIQATAALDTGEGVANLIQPAGTVQDEHWLLAHSFESEVFAFPQERSEQRELTFPQSIRGIAPQISDLKRFCELLRFSGESHSIQAEYKEALREKVEESRKKIQDGLQTVRSRIAEQESRLRQLESQPEADRIAIEELRRELDTLRHQEKELTDAMKHAEKARQLLS